MNRIEDRLRDFADISLSMSAEKDRSRLLMKIVTAAMDMTNADGGTIYDRIDKDNLAVEVILNRSMKIETQSDLTTGSHIAKLPLFNPDGSKNVKNLAAVAAHENSIINIEDRLTNTRFDFSGVSKFDQDTGYNTSSILTIPLSDYTGEVLGVLQLINARDPVTGNNIPFDDENQAVAQSFASLAAVAMKNRQLILELEELFESFIVVIAETIDAKSPHTGQHCRKVPEVSISLCNALDRKTDGPFKDFKLSDNDRFEMKIAAWLHDCGKIATPEHIVEKSTKLQTITDRIHEVNQRFDTLKRVAEINFLKREIAHLKDPSQPAPDNAELEAYFAKVDEDQAFVNLHNRGSEFMPPEAQARVQEIADSYQRIDADGNSVPLLTDNEIKNLTIDRGTLTHEERQIINNHIVVTINMLESLKLPRNLSNVPEIAGGHHERMDGKGYPKGLTRDELSIQTRVIGIADIFEALTSSDRPYKDPNTVSQALNIMTSMTKNGHIDPDIFEVFLTENVYQDFADGFLLESQIDEVDIPALLDRLRS